MKKFTSSIIGLLALVLTFGAFYQADTYEEKESMILHGVLNFIKQVHVNPKPIDDVFSKDVFHTYLERIDNGKRFFTEKEIVELSKHELNLDEEAEALTLNFFDQSFEMLNNGIARSKSIYQDLIENHEFDINSPESIELDDEKTNYAEDEKALRDVWRKYLKYDIVRKYHRKLEKRKKAIEKKEADQREIDAQGKSDDGDNDMPGLEVVDITVKTDADLLKEAKEETKENFDDWFERLDKLRRTDRFETYLGSITNYFDPHTDYFNPKQKQDFDINMGGKLEGIGARLSTDGEFTKVVSIIPGGPAYRGKDLEVDDLIIAVAQENEEPIDIQGWRIDDVVQKIRGKKGTVVTLTTQKSDGTVVDIQIERDKVIIDESFARSSLISLPGTASNIGYIKLPKFYSSFEKEDGNSCAKDVAKEIEKLKAENVNGIILDLRYNTGGSLSDVVDMSGLFIEEGPIVQVKPKARKAYVHEDTDPTVLYDGPLIIMTNHQSASASEILAAALQDYGRAIIVGSKSTFGKGSVQRFFDLDRAFSGNDDFKPLGNLKISMQKFYRINGGSTQLNGVVPDVILPNSYHYIETGEKEYDNALAWDEIEPEDYSQNVVNLKHKGKIAELSRARIEKDEEFQMILENAKRLKENRDFSQYPINLNSYQSLMADRQKEADKFKDFLEEDIPYLQVQNLPVDTAYIQSEESRIGRNEEWIKSLKKDVYLEETLHILRDLINLEDSYSAIEERFEAMENKKIKP